MKHIKSISELYKSTLRSAAEKLKYQHPSRSSNLMNWADTKGESEFSKVDVGRDYPHPFQFNNKSLQDVKDDLLGKFYITGSYETLGLRSGYYGINVRMMSEWGNLVEIYLVSEKNPDSYLKMLIRFGPLEEYQMGIVVPKFKRDTFLFDNRKDALQFKKYLIEICGSGELNVGFDPHDIKINKLYYTE